MMISYGAISNNFAIIAKLSRLLEKVKDGSLIQSRHDCYELTDHFFLTKFDELNIERPKAIEIFYPSQQYPPHIDKGGVSYFIPLENGNFYFDGITYPIVPFVLYAFEDGIIHNSNFCSIMLK